MNWIERPIDDHVTRLFLPGRTRQLVARPNAFEAWAYVPRTGGFQATKGPMRTAPTVAVIAYVRGVAGPGGGWHGSPQAARIIGRRSRASPQAPESFKWMPSELNQFWPCAAAFQSAIVTCGHFAASVRIVA